MDCLGRRSTFLSHDFGLPRRGSSSTIPFGSLDSLHSSSGTSSSSAWALGLISNGPKSPDPLAPHLITALMIMENRFLSIYLSLSLIFPMAVNLFIFFRQYLVATSKGFFLIITWRVLDKRTSTLSIHMTSDVAKIP